MRNLATVPLMVLLLAVGPWNIVSAQSAVVGKSNFVPPNRMVILDYSGSMSETYYRNAREAALRLTESAASVDINAKTGLVVFGHTLGSWGESGYGQDQHCADIEIEFDYGELNASRDQEFAKAENQLRQLKPGGETPLVKSVELAAQQLGSDGGSVILVTDLDEEMCSNPPNNDPCLVMDDLIATYARSSIFITHVIAVKTNKNAGAKQLAQCSGATLIKLGSDPRDIDPIVFRVNKELKEKLLPVILDINIGYASTPILIPNSTSVASIRVVDDNGSEKRFPYTHFTSKAVKAGPTNVLVEVGEMRKKVSINVSQTKYNVVNVSLTPTRVQLRLEGPQGIPIPTDVPVDWIFSGPGGEEKTVSGNSEITVNALPFKHEVQASYPGYIGKISFTTFDGQGRMVRSIRMEPVGLPEGGTKTGRVYADFDFSNLPFYAPPIQHLSLIMTPMSGPHSVISLGSSWPNEVSEGEYKFFLDTTVDKILLGKLKIRSGTRIDVVGSVPSVVLGIKTEPSVSDEAVWMLSDGNSEFEFQGSFFRQEIYPGEYKVTVTDGGARAEISVSLPAVGGNVERVIKM